MTNVDVAALASELASLVVGARVDRAYQPGRDVILLRLRRKGTGKVDLLFELGKFLTATRRPPENPDKPSMLAQVLRDKLENARVVGFRQIGFDRLLRMDLERGDGPRSVVFELFGDGNLLLLDAAGVIELPMRGSDFGARRLRKGEPYVAPPGASLPFGLDVAALQAASAGKRDLVRFLAVDLGFGPLWGEELALRSGVGKNLPVAQLDAAQWLRVHAELQRLGGDIARNDLAPALVHRAGEQVDAVPFAMLRYPSPEFSHEEAPSFREALDAFFVGGPESDEEGDEPDDPRRGRYEEARAKVLRQVQQMDEAIGRFVEEEAEHQRDGEAVYASFTRVQAILEALHKARAERPWTEVEARLAQGRAEGNAFALQVPELRPHNGTAVLELAGAEGEPRRVEVDLRLTVQQNAERAFDAAKKARSRREGAEAARKDAMAKLAAIEAAGLDAFGAAPQRVERTSRHFWFESYRWTLTPSGLVAVGGRNGAQNDAVVKKYLREGDRYVHAEIHGAPSIVVRPAEGVAADISTADLRAACHFAVVSSRAWRQYGPATAYWVNASQVSKTPRSGEFVPRGAWIIHGKRNVEPDLPMQWWVAFVELRMDGTPVPKGTDAGGRTVRKLVGATLDSLRPYADKATPMLPGPIGPADAAQWLVAKYGVTNEEAAAVLPAGSVQFLEDVAL
ncbi:MAG: hypothetical protein QOD77_928 [Thermoplasmata archaeon]|nr:hypothetical protein [Thermoplasmata archaeon]